jgi:hypothetical protein
MLKIVVLSMLLGAVAFFIGLSQLYSVAVQPGPAVEEIVWDPSSAKVAQGVATLIDGGLEIQLPPSGVTIVSPSDRRFAAQAYPFLHIGIEDSSQHLKVSISWKSTTNANKHQSYTLESELRSSLWLATHELKGWEGEIHSLSLMISGEPGETVAITDFSFFGASGSRQLSAIFSDFAAYAPWRRGSMNSYTGVTSASSFYPVPLVATYLALCLLAYALLLFWKTKLQFDWRVVAVIFLACWIALDLSWQNRLLHQLADTHHTFSGKDTAEKLAVGPDGKLFDFVSEVKLRLETEDPRIFVASSDEYQGLRGAYYLYPFNVFWALRGQELPHREFMHSGDYIVAIEPTETVFSPVVNAVGVDGGGSAPAEIVFSNKSGTLYRVK